MQLTSPMQHENGSMRLNVVNDVVKLTLLFKVTVICDFFFVA